MAEQAFSNPTISVNDETVAIIPNTLMTKNGHGETKVRAVSTGGGGGGTVHTVDAESRFSVVKFDLPNTAANAEKVRQWKSAIGTNTVSFFERVGGDVVERTFTGQSIVNDPEFEASADGKVSIEFNGDPAV